ncbi:MAG TPA: TerC family protein [Candidatus Angelobacter sp.]|nr:TerC family protein [Candidatus Angelobacter sp.]
MDFFHNLATTYGQFFSVGVLSAALTNPSSWGVIFSLVILEGLLSADNALVLAVMVRHLPKKSQKKALFYGIIGAYLFRFIAIGIGVFLIKFTWIKVLGGLYLLWLAGSNIFKKEEEDGQVENKGFGFWKTVLLVELMDITFSLDSVIAAFGISNQVWVLFLGGILGVLMMRGVAQLFLLLIEKFPEFEMTAFILIAIIGIKMLLGAIGFEIGELIFFAILVVVFLATFVVHSFRKGDTEKQH